MREGTRPALGGRTCAFHGAWSLKALMSGERCLTSPMRPPGGRVGRGPGFPRARAWGNVGLLNLLAPARFYRIPMPNCINPRRTGATE